MKENSNDQGKDTPTKGNGSANGEDRSEGKLATMIEQQTSKLPSDLFLWAAAGSIGTSLVLQLTGNDTKSRFVGQWVAPFLLLGVYNKVVKVAGSDRTENRI